MPRVLVIAYYFPPLGGAGVQRTVKLLKHLPSLGFEPVVLAPPKATELDWAPQEERMLAEVSDAVEVRRVGSPHPPASGGLRRRADRALDRPTAFARWWAQAVEQAGMDLARGVDLVYASMSPFETAAAASRVAAAANVPWVADLRDPWALDEWTIFPTALHRVRDERRMRRSLSTAAAVIMNTAEAGREVARCFPELAARVSVIPNGWDRDDLSVAPEARDPERFRVVYTGYSHVAAGLRQRRRRRIRELTGGSVKGLDVLARSHLLLVEAMERAAAEDPRLGEQLELHVAGAAPTTQVTPPFVIDRGYLPHDAAVALVRSADVLFLPMHDLPPGRRARSVPGKTYEYLGSGRPILGALPDGDARDLLAGLANVRLCRPTDVDCMAEALHSFFETRPIETAVPELAWTFERRAQAEQIAEVFERALGARRLGTLA
jgi:glycosyltransferase involved in cell wall biosynthesis